MTGEEDVNVVRSKVPVLKSGYRGHVFQCRFPFSWILKERIDELYREAKSIAGEINEKKVVRVCVRACVRAFVCVCVCVCVVFFIIFFFNYKQLTLSSSCVLLGIT